MSWSKSLPAVLKSLMASFPTPCELRKRYEAGMGFSLEDERAKPLLVHYTGGEVRIS
jgi:hypothetical protein